VVKIQCKEASGKKEAPDKLWAGTGFAWPDSTHIATALHVVAGCQALTVMLGDTKWSASLEKVLVGSDLALLKLTSRPNTPPGSPASLLVPLASAPNVPDPKLGHAIWGYPCCDNPKQAQKDPVTFGSKPEFLGDFISLETYKNELHADPPTVQGSPASSTGILTIMSAIRQGHSGAPILERDVVVGVADGGLHQGLRSLNWAIPSSMLTELRNSKEPVASYKKQRMSWPVLFSAEDHGEDLSIGLGHGDSLAYIWSAEVEEIVATTTHDERDDIDEEMTRYQHELSRVEGHGDEAAGAESAGADLSAARPYRVSPA
jgi:Trypsin-like peptidase domain